MYKNRNNGVIITEKEYFNLSYSERSNYFEYSSSSNDDDDNTTNLLVSGAIGYVTDSALLGGLVGGSMLGGIIGDVLNTDESGDGGLFDNLFD